MTQELLRRLTRSGSMYLIPADIHTKRILRFTVTSQYTTADDVLRDWGIISKMASHLLAEAQPLSHVKPGEDQAIGVEEDRDLDEEEPEDPASRMDKAQVELWIDKTWNRSRRPMRSLSCNSEPLPYSCVGPPPSYGFDARSRPKDVAVTIPMSTGGSTMTKISETPSGPLGKQVLKKLTKFYSVPSFCNQWVQCVRPQLCCPLKVMPAAQKLVPPVCRRVNCLPSSPVSKPPAPATPLEAPGVYSSSPTHTQ